MDNCSSCSRPWPGDLILGRLAGCPVCTAEEKRRLRWFEAQYKKALKGKVQTNG